jgi:hypothetical protein
VISDKHRDLYRAYYNQRVVSHRPSGWLPRIEALAAKLGAETIIDYGCGAARGVSRYSKYPVADYDPGVAGCVAIPEPADLVVSMHMLEHVEPQYVWDVIEHMKSLAKIALLLAVSCEESTKVLPDGSPWHSFVQPAHWWNNHLHDFTPQKPQQSRVGAEYVGLWIRPSAR